MMVRVSRFSPADSIAEAALEGMLPIWMSVKFYGWLWDARRWWWDPHHSALCCQESWPVSRCMGYLKRGLDSAAISFNWKPTSSEGNGGREAHLLSRGMQNELGTNTKTASSCHWVAFWYCGVFLFLLLLPFSLRTFLPNGIEFVCLFSKPCNSELAKMIREAL